MQIIDAHHHLWDLNRHHYPWLAHGGKVPSGQYEPICPDYLIEDFRRDVGDLELIKSVHVQAEIDRTLTTNETAWLQEIADADPRGIPNAIVAYADLSAPDVQSTLEAHIGYANIRGIRQILNRHPDPRLNVAPRDYLRDPIWMTQFGLLERYGLSFDLQIYYQQAIDALTLARRYPRTVLILNHMGMPIESGNAHEGGWRRAMRDLASCDNIAVKISGFGMNNPTRTIERIGPFIEHTLEVFGTNRCMFGSNFPVDRVFSDYRALWNAYETLVGHLSLAECQAVFVGNAAFYYRI